jgi:hypothetical protein
MSDGSIAHVLARDIWSAADLVVGTRSDAAFQIDHVELRAIIARQHHTGPVQVTCVMRDRPEAGIPVAEGFDHNLCAATGGNAALQEWPIGPHKVAAILDPARRARHIVSLQSRRGRKIHTSLPG